MNQSRFPISKSSLHLGFDKASHLCIQSFFKFPIRLASGNSGDLPLTATQPTEQLVSSVSAQPASESSGSSSRLERYESAQSSVLSAEANVLSGGGGGSDVDNFVDASDNPDDELLGPIGPTGPKFPLICTGDYQLTASNTMSLDERLAVQETHEVLYFPIPFTPIDGNIGHVVLFPRHESTFLSTQRNWREEVSTQRNWRDENLTEEDRGLTEVRPSSSENPDELSTSIYSPAYSAGHHPSPDESIPNKSKFSLEEWNHAKLIQDHYLEYMDTLTRIKFYRDSRLELLNQWKEIVVQLQAVTKPKETTVGPSFSVKITQSFLDYHSYVKAEDKNIQHLLDHQCSLVSLVRETLKLDPMPPYYIISKAPEGVDRSNLAHHLLVSLTEAKKELKSIRSEEVYTIFIKECLQNIITNFNQNEQVYNDHIQISEKLINVLTAATSPVDLDRVKRLVKRVSKKFTPDILDLLREKIRKITALCVNPLEKNEIETTLENFVNSHEKIKPMLEAFRESIKHLTGIVIDIYSTLNVDLSGNILDQTKPVSDKYYEIVGLKLKRLGTHYIPLNVKLSEDLNQFKIKFSKVQLPGEQNSSLIEFRKKILEHSDNVLNNDLQQQLKYNSLVEKYNALQLPRRLSPEEQLINTSIITQLDKDIQNQLHLVQKQLLVKKNLHELINKMNEFFPGIEAIEMIRQSQEDRFTQLMNGISILASIKPKIKKVLSSFLRESHSKNSFICLKHFIEIFESKDMHISGKEKDVLGSLILNYVLHQDQKEQIIAQLCDNLYLVDTMLVESLNINLQYLNTETSESTVEMLIDKPLIVICNHPIISEIVNEIENKFPGTEVQKEEFQILMKKLALAQADGVLNKELFSNILNQIRDANSSKEMLLISICDLLNASLLHFIDVIPKFIKIMLKLDKDVSKDDYDEFCNGLTDLKKKYLQQNIHALKSLDFQQIMEIYENTSCELENLLKGSEVLGFTGYALNLMTKLGDSVSISVEIVPPSDKSKGGPSAGEGPAGRAGPSGSANSSGGESLGSGASLHTAQDHTLDLFNLISKIFGGIL